MNAWTMVGSVWPTLRVPGMRSSRTSFHCRKIDVVVAYDPMPRVSKKLVTKPVVRSAHGFAPGSTRSPGGCGRRIPATRIATYASVVAPRARKRMSRASRLAIIRMREAGCGKRDAGCGTRDAGRYSRQPNDAAARPGAPLGRGAGTRDEGRGSRWPLDASRNPQPATRPFPQHLIQSTVDGIIGNMTTDG